MKNNKEVTIYDIASELKVSPSTVSRALKDHSSIGKDMIRAVKKLALEKGYQPNHLAASLRRNRTHTIGVIISWVNRPFISSLISGVEEVANKADFNVIISQSHDSFDSEVINAKALYNSRISGLVVSLAMQTTSYDHFTPYLKAGLPIVFVDRVSEVINTNRVVIDNFAAGFTAANHLIEQGCRRIAHLAGAQHRNVYRDRLNGYIEALKHNNLPIDENLIVYGKIMNAEEGQKLTHHLMSLPVPPDAIFSANDTAAVSAIQYAKQRGIAIPDQLAVVGFNNDPISLIIDPQLSTIAHPATEMGRIAATQIINHQAQPESVAYETVVLKTELVVRQSSLRNQPR